MLVAVDGDGGTDGDFAASLVAGRLSSDAVGPSGAVFLPAEAATSSTGSEVRSFFDGVDEGARPSQRLDRFEHGVVAVDGVAIGVLGLGK